MLIHFLRVAAVVQARLALMDQAVLAAMVALVRHHQFLVRLLRMPVVVAVVLVPHKALVVQAVVVMQEIQMAATAQLILVAVVAAVSAVPHLEPQLAEMVALAL